MVPIVIRLFTAIEIPDEIAARLLPMQQGFDGARWIERESFHITLRFIGDVAEDVADDIDEALSKIPFTPFNLSLEGVGVFGNEKPHALYAGVQPSEALTILQGRHESAMRRVGLKPETRKFTPHVTLARLQGFEVDEAQSFVMANNLFATPAFEVARFILYSAKGNTGGGPYLAERTYPDGVYADDLGL
tara:strand:+ start:15868 stop:16437 length:570 start_codon:yes stop_codon:yes gene_type:complete